MIGHVRLDAIESVLIARAYVCPVDIDAPLCDMTAPYVAVATVTVAGDTAYVQALHGALTPTMRHDFRVQIAAQWVNAPRFSAVAVDRRVRFRFALQNILKKCLTCV